ncbi:unnamed protein product [Spirodela intermedia]|uniref:Uncharacterized protein n=1 Tax=Spirodela intermedia TaxID=51605 RepID=A0A7I8JE48_SPIIN|nr:unnamed protein product [Spirodela intermedia]CAA6668035.1 unnamed protein product [Spirodela intermedia]
MPEFLQEVGDFSASSISPVFLLSILVFLSAAYYLRRHPKNKKGLRLPPSPPRLPLIGNLHQLSALLTAPSESFPGNTAPDATSPRADPHSRGLIRGGGAGGAQDPGPRLRHQALLRRRRRPHQSLRNVSFAPYGEHWRQGKKAAVVHLLSPNKVQSLRRTREEERDLYAFSNGFVCRVVAGSSAAREVRTQRFREAIDGATALLSGPRLEELFPSLAWVTKLPGADSRLKKLAKKWNALLDEIVAEHERRAGKREEAEEVDFIDLLLSADPADLIAAGTDTSYVVLEWAMAELLKNPALLERTQREVREAAGGKPAPTEDDVASMPRLRAVVKEVLRLHMPAPLLIPREAMEATRVLGYDVPAGTRVFINAWAMATDPEWWEAPEEFRPERFLREEKAAPPADLRGSDFQFLPFGAGRRMCPGMNFALCEVELALASLLYCFDWSLPDGAAPEGLDMAESPGITVRRKTPLRLIAVPNSAVLA